MLANYCHSHIVAIAVDLPSKKAGACKGNHSGILTSTIALELERGML
jgi:hypothetical protein